jgi:ParB family transcriptional regulator, chromosome partitioning protein
MSKKTYALPKGLSSEIGNTVEIVKNNIGTLNYKIVPLNAIEFDPENPRELSIQKDDLTYGLQPGDIAYDKKMKELESLKEMAETIKKYGVRNAVEIYKFGAGYRLIHGERRCLSSMLAGKKDIPAKVLDEKPNDLDVRLLQFIENVQREDLNLYETLNNIRQILNEYKRPEIPEFKIDANFLEGLINRSRTVCFNYLSILNATSEIQDAIKDGKIRSLEKAVVIANATNKNHKQLLLEACLDGASLKQLKKEAKILKDVKMVPRSDKPPIKPGKKAEKINMGSTRNKAVITKLVNLVALDKRYFAFTTHFESMKFDTFGDCVDSFNSLIKIMEKVEPIE